MPYTFKQLEGRSGSFTEHSSYGCLSVNNFSSYAIAAEGDVDLLYVASLYVASLYYQKADPRTVEIQFTINVDDEIHNTVSDRLCGFCVLNNILRSILSFCRYNYDIR